MEDNRRDGERQPEEWGMRSSFCAREPSLFGEVKKGDGKVAYSLFVGQSRVSLGKCMNGFSSF